MARTDRPPLQGALIDRATQRWVIATGRRLRIDEHPWLDGPVGDPDGIGEAWIDEHARRHGATVTADPDGGLLPTMDAVARDDFDPGALAAPIRDFYENTAAYDLDLWARWSRWAEPGGRLMNAVFSNRLRQLALPMDPLSVSRGMTSQVLTMRRNGSHLGTVWQRTLRSTDQTVFGGLYGVTELPRGRGPAIRVSFPLPNGSVTVFLRPQHRPGGGMRLQSGAGPFGDVGAYLVVRPRAGDEAWVRRVPLHERFDLEVDTDGSGRCEHQLDLGPAESMRLHYRMRRRGH